MQIRRFIGLLLVCTLAFALLLTGCNAAPDVPNSGTTTTTTATGGNDVEGDTTTDGGNDNTTSGDNTTTDGGNNNTTNGGNNTTNGGNNTTNGGNNTTNGGNNNTTTGGKNTTTKKTTTSTSSSAKEEVLLPSFERLSNGTCKDRDTGVVFIDDDCNSMSIGSEGCYMYDHGGKIWTDTLNKTLFNNDPVRIIRGDTTTSSAWWFSYKIDAGITEAALVTFNNHTKTRARGFDIYVSADGRKWTKVEPTYNQKEDLDLGYEGWIQRTYKVSGIDKKNKFLKIQFTAIDGEQYEPLIGRVRINNVGKMNDSTRFLEGRSAKTFYVSASGKDGNDGLSASTPMKPEVLTSRYFQPGDKILFKSGETMTGSTIRISGFGSASKRITISTYGGTKPAVLTTRGEGTKARLELFADYVTVENLTISNPLGEIGLSIAPAHSGANKDIIVQNCNFKDINKNADTFRFETGGIYAVASGGEPTWFENMTIRNNTFDNIARIAVFVTSKWAERTEKVGNKYVNGDNPWYANKNVNVSSNTLTNILGDGLLIIGCDKAIMEKNFVNNAYCISDSTLKKYAGTMTTSAAAIWTQNVDKAYIQYNEVGYTNLPDHVNGGADGTAFDIDAYCTEHYIQYNYSHDNEGGFILLCEFDCQPGTDWYKMLDDTQHEIRFNLSLNDGCKPGFNTLIATLTVAQMNIYNNTFVKTATNSGFVGSFNKLKDYYFKNNIFYGAGACKIGNHTNSTNVVFDNNIFYGGTPSTNATVKNTKNVDPKFKNASFTNPYNKAMAAEAIKAFTPQNKVTGATSISNNGGKDLAGTAISSTNFYGCIKY